METYSVKEAIKEHGFTSSEAAAMLGVSKRQYFRLMNGEAPLKVDHIAAVCAATGLEIYEWVSVCLPYEKCTRGVQVHAIDVFKD